MQQEYCANGRLSIELRIAVLEDEILAAEKMKRFLLTYQQEHPEYSFDIEHYQEGAHLLDQYRKHYDVVFLDIQMPGIDGMETARRIRAIDSDVILVFVTNMMEYAIEGYAVQAFDYILKPVSYVEFQPKLERILRAITVQKDHVMLKLKQKDGLQWVSSNDILYLEVFDHDVFIYQCNGVKSRQPGPLSRFEKVLQKVCFARNNACYLVNLKYVQCTKGDFVRIGGTDLPISKSRRKEFLGQLAQYKGRSR